MEESLTEEDLERPESCETVVSEDDLQLSVDVKKPQVGKAEKGSSKSSSLIPGRIELAC